MTDNKSKQWSAFFPLKLYFKGENMNKHEAGAFNWEDEYVPDFMPEEGNYNEWVRYAMKLGTL